MARFVLIRHGETDQVNRIVSGRTPGIHLNSRGRSQAIGVAERLMQTRLEAIYCSPLERTTETASFIGERLGLPFQRNEAFIETDCGEWTGLTYDQVKATLQWPQYVIGRGRTPIPGGESLSDVQTRFVVGLEKLRHKHPNEAVVAIITHADPIKSALAYYGGMDLDYCTRIEIFLASISVIAFYENDPRILLVNETGTLPLPLVTGPPQEH